MKKKKNRQQSVLKFFAFLVIVAVIIAAVYFIQKANNGVSYEISVEEAQTIIDDTLRNLPNVTATCSKYIAEKSNVKVNSVKFGTDKDAILDCSYETLDSSGIIANIDKYMTDVYGFYYQNQQNGVKTNATKIKQFIAGKLEEALDDSDKVTGNLTLTLYEVTSGNYVLDLSRDTVNTVFGGLLDVKDTIYSINEVDFEGKKVNITNLNTLRTGINDCVAFKNYDSKKPDTSVPIEKTWNNLKSEFYKNFIYKNRWTYLTNGLLTTLEITFVAVLIGIIIGFIVAVIRCINEKTGKLSIASAICKVYLAVIRGMPVMVQLIILYFVVLLPLGVEKHIAAIICFGINSGAYVSEIVRGGLMSIEEGQTEAGRSLGLTYPQTMLYIIIPQAFKVVLPSLANEFIALLKESSIAFYIGVADLTMGGIKIRSITYSNFMPLLAIGIIYLAVVLGLSKCVEILERRLHKGDRYHKSA